MDWTLRGDPAEYYFVPWDVLMKGRVDTGGRSKQNGPWDEPNIFIFYKTEKNVTRLQALLRCGARMAGLFKAGAMGDPDIATWISKRFVPFV